MGRGVRTVVDQGGLPCFAPFVGFRKLISIVQDVLRLKWGRIELFPWRGDDFVFWSLSGNVF